MLFLFLVHVKIHFYKLQSQNTIKDPQWYVVQVSDTTMLSIEPSAGTIKLLHTILFFEKMPLTVQIFKSLPTPSS